MEATIRCEDGKTTAKATSTDKSNAKPPSQPPNSHPLEDDAANPEDNGLEFLNWPPSLPNLAGQDCRAFFVAKEVDLASPILLDVLADKGPNNNTRSASRVRATAPAPQN